jgi:hypothetical protein
LLISNIVGQPSLAGICSGIDRFFRQGTDRGG